MQLQSYFPNPLGSDLLMHHFACMHAVGKKVASKYGQTRQFSKPYASVLSFGNWAAGWVMAKLGEHDAVSLSLIPSRQLSGPPFLDPES